MSQEHSEDSDDGEHSDFHCPPRPRNQNYLDDLIRDIGQCQEASETLSSWFEDKNLVTIFRFSEQGKIVDIPSFSEDFENVSPCVFQIHLI